MNFPLLIFVTSLGILLLSTWFGDALRRRAGVTKEERTEVGLLVSPILTLLFLIIGFSFSMAVNRYDIRRNAEQAEAIAIGTLYARADLLAPADAPKVRALLKRYLDQRLSFYATSRPADALTTGTDTDADTARLQAEVWSAIQPALAAVPAPLMGALVTGVNDLVNSQRTTQAAWVNRIPLGAWALMAIISVGSCWLLAYRARWTDWVAFAIVPVAVSVSLFLIADLDSPRGGVIRVTPLNLSSLSQSLKAP
jgi:hypothetical protein